MATANINLNPKELTLRTNHVFVSVAEAFLAVRVVLRLFNVEATNGFAQWVYEMSDTLLSPLRNVFTAQSFSSDYVVDFVALFGMVAYMVLGLFVVTLVTRFSKH